MNTFLVAFATLFATVGVADIAFIFAALTKDNTPAQRRIFATRGVLIALAILLFFAVLGNAILDVFGITIPALRTAGGVLLLLIAIDMVFARHSGGTGTTDEEEREARQSQDISVFPLAIGANSDLEFWLVLAAIVVILALCWLTLLIAIPIQRLLGLTGLSVVSRVVGILLAALAVQFVFDGIKASGLLGG